MNKFFSQFNTGIQILNKYNVTEFALEPICQTYPDCTPKHASSAYVMIALDWDDQDKMLDEELMTLKDNKWRKEDGMGVTYWTFRA